MPDSIEKSLLSGSGGQKIKKIVAKLATDKAVSPYQLSKRLNLPYSTTFEKLKTLKEKGIIIEVDKAIASKSHREISLYGLSKNGMFLAAGIEEIDSATRSRLFIEYAEWKLTKLSEEPLPDPYEFWILSLLSELIKTKEHHRHALTLIQITHHKPGLERYSRIVEYDMKYLTEKSKDSPEFFNTLRAIYGRVLNSMPKLTKLITLRLWRNDIENLILGSKLNASDLASLEVILQESKFICQLHCDACRRTWLEKVDVKIYFDTSIDLYCDKCGKKLT